MDACIVSIDAREKSYTHLFSCAMHNLIICAPKYFPVSGLRWMRLEKIGSSIRWHIFVHSIKDAGRVQVA